MKAIKKEQAKGIVNASFFHQHFSLQRFHPSPKLSDIVEHYWLVKWQLPDNKSYTQSVIPHPNTHLTFMKNSSHIQGICQAKYSHTMVGNGEVFGVKFKPAGFFPFAKNAKIAMSTLVNQVVDIQAFFSDIQDLQQIESYLFGLKNADQKINFIERILFSNEVLVVEQMILANKIVATIESDKSIVSVSDLCHVFQLESRALQRLFNKYVGVSAKWIINRFRIHEALTHIEATKAFDWANLAVELGYYDQAHFIKDFKALVGVTPKQHQAGVLS